MTIYYWERGDSVPKQIGHLDQLEEVLHLTDIQADMLFIAAHRPPKYGEYHAFSTRAQEPVLRNPYKGLQAFDVADAGDFFGRDRLIDKLVEVLENGQGTQLLALLGASGSGKTSVMMAGVLPRLQGGALPGSQQWRYLRRIVPGEKPLEALAQVLSEHLPKSRDLIEQDLRDPAMRGLSLLTQSLVEQSGIRVVLIIDQFEELYQQACQPDAQHFIDLLVSAITEPQSGLLVLLALRADCYHYILAPPTPPAFAQLVREHQLLVLSMTRDELREVIEKPAARSDVQLTFDPRLVEKLLAEIHGQAGALPLLEFTLYQLVDKSPYRHLTLHVYQEIGGVKGALAHYADEVYKMLPPERRVPFVRYVFLRLVLLDMETSRLHVPMRRRAPLHEFTLRDPQKTEAVLDVISLFITARLLVMDRVVEGLVPEGGLDSQDQEEEEQGAFVSTLEVSHEALLQEWEQLKNWLAEAPEDLRHQQRISRDVAEWEASGRSRERLYRRKQFKQARVLAKKVMLSQKEEAFLQASARRRLQSVMSVIIIVVLLISSIGAAEWYWLHQPPNPTQVTTLGDDDIGSLRWCINHARSGSIITFNEQVRGTIMLISDDIAVNKPLTIRGPGANVLAVSSTLDTGRNSDPGIHVFSDTTLTISGLSFKNSQFLGKSFITNQGTLRLINVTLSGNRATFGSSIISNTCEGCILSLIDSTLSGNSVINNVEGSISGGGIYNFGTMTVINSTLSDNSVLNGDGGAIANDGTMTMTNSTLSDNFVLNGNGGAIVNDGTMTMTNSTLSGNSATDSGGGIYNYDGTMTVTNSTLSDNDASNGAGILTISVFNPDSLTGQQYPSRNDLFFCTIVDNTSSQGGEASLRCRLQTPMETFWYPARRQ